MGTRHPGLGTVRFHSSSKVGPFSYQRTCGILTTASLGVALYIYGAPKDELERLVDGDDYHSDVEVCIDTECYPIDNHQTYLNLEGTARHLPVLLWSGNGFSPAKSTHVRIRLMDVKTAIDSVKGFGLERVVYTEVLPKK